MTFHIERHESPDRGIRRIATEQITFALRDLEDPSLAPDRKIHSLRKRCKKLRGLLRLVRPLMGATFDIEDQRFRDTARVLARARDESVRAAIVEDIADRVDAEQPREATVSGDELCDVRTRFVAALEAVDTWPFELHGFADMAPGLAQTYRRCVEARERVADAPDDANYHRLRKWTKYHWYHVRMLERVNRPVLRRRRRRLKKLQLLLGDAHDLAVLATDPGTSEVQVVQQAKARKERLYGRARQRAAKLFSDAPDRLVADIATWWVAWR